MSNALYFLVKTLGHLLILLFLLRLWLPLLGTDFRNPLAQSILKLSSPLINPLRRFIPAIGKLDTATFLIVFVLQFVLIFLLTNILGFSAQPLSIFISTFFELDITSLNVVLFAIVIVVILSWVAPHSYNPATALLRNVTEPVLRPLRRMIPPLGGIDLSPLFALLAIQAIIIILKSYRPLQI